MGLRTRIAEIIGGKDLLQEGQRQTQQIVKEMFDAYLDGPWEVDPEMLIERLKEYDSAALVDLLHDVEYERIAGLYSSDNQGRRDRQVKESQRMWLNSPLATWTVNVWTSYGLGENVKIKCDDEKAQEIWDACALRSDIYDSDKIHELSNWTLVDGNIFLVQFVSTLDGTSTWDLMDTDEIVDIIKDEMTGKPVWYKRQFITARGDGRVWYYPNSELYLSENWPDNAQTLLPQGAISTENMPGNQNTVALVLHIAHNRKDKKSLWGWPILGVTSPYMRAHKEFVENRLTVSRNKASAVREYTTKGGSRGVAALQAKLNSTLSSTNILDKNPGMPAGSELIHNDAVSMKDLSMNTGAGDAKSDNEMFAWLALIGAGLFPTSAGLDTSRWATAVAMDKTQATQWTRYQTFWSNNLRRIVELTLRASERWGSTGFESYGATVSIDTLSLVDFPGVVGPMSQMINSMQPFVENGTIPDKVAKETLQALWMIILQSLGVNDAYEILSDENFEITADTQKAEVWAELRKLNRIMEFNPNHGADGRFTSGSGSPIDGISDSQYNNLMSISDPKILVSSVMSSGLSTAKQEEFFRHYKDKKMKSGKTEEKKPEVDDVKNAIDYSKINNTVDKLPDATGNSVWAVRFTNNPKRDMEDKVSYVDWGISPYKNKKDAQSDYPGYRIVYDKTVKGYLPALSGLSSFSDSSAKTALWKANKWSGGGSAYKYVVVYKAKFSGTGPDGEDLTIPEKEMYIFKQN